MLNKIFLLALTAVLAACVTPQTVDPATEAIAREPLRCKDKATCDVYWSRAQAWVANNSAWKISVATDTLIETHSGISELERRTAYKITLVRSMDGSAQIIIYPVCRLGGNSCNPHPLNAAASFKNFVLER